MHARMHACNKHHDKAVSNSMHWGSTLFLLQNTCPQKI